MSAPVLLQLRDPGTGRWQSGDVVGEGTLGALASSIGRRPLWLVLPIERVALHLVTLPGRNRATWLKALPYALEDQVADDIESLHFALAERTTGDGRIAATAVRRDLMDAQLAQLAAAGLRARRCVPDALLLPWEPGYWSVWLEGRRAVVRHGPWQGFACDPAQLVDWLALELKNAHERPRGFLVWCDDAELACELPLPVERRAESGWAAIAAVAWQGEPPIDLLQGRFQPGIEFRQWLTPWRPAAVLALAWLIIAAGQQWVEHRALRERQDALQARSVAIFLEAMPGSRVVDPRAQMETRLRELGTGTQTTDSSFLALVWRGGEQLAAIADGRRPSLVGLRYANGRLDMQLSGGALEALDGLKSALEQTAGVPVDVRSSVRGDQIESTVSLLGAAR